MAPDKWEERNHTSELLSIDGLATSAVTTGEVTTLEHERRNNTVETRSCITEAVLACRQFAEVLRRLWDDIIVELEDDAAERLAVGGDVKLREYAYF